MNYGFLFTLLLATPGLAFAQAVPLARDTESVVMPPPGTGDVARVPEAVHAPGIATDVKRGMHHGYYRPGWPSVETEATASVLVESVGVAPVAAPWGDDIHHGVNAFAAADWANDAYDRNVLEPERAAMGAWMRERHRRAKAEHAAQINAAARYNEPFASSPRSVATCGVP